MTREEALQILSERDRIGVNIINANDAETTKYNNNSVEALSMAIAAFKAEPCEAVSRQAVNDLVDELARAISDERCCISRGRSTATIMQDILDLPPVTPKQRTGEWIIDERPESNRETICTNCEQPIFGYHKLDFDYRPHFCPNCGADMRGGE